MIKRDFPNLSEDLCKRVVSGMLLQRRQILYRRSRQEKLDVRRFPITSSKPLRELQLPKVAKSSSPSINDSGAEVPRIAGSETCQSVAMSQHTATTLQPDQFHRAAANPSQISVARTAPLDTRDRALLPPAPKVQGHDVDFTCPYCSMLVQGQVALDSGRWA